MVKRLLLLALTAQTFFWVTSTERSSQSYYRRYDRSCRANEIWVRCPDAVCAPKTCSDVGFPVPCYDLKPDGKCPSKPECICKEGFVRNNKGICVPMRQCPSCGGDPNAESGCGTNCNRLCSNYNQKNVSCIQGCLYNQCECKRGYVFDEVTKKCVRPFDCTPPVKCQKNEVYDLCPASCPFRTCGINDAAVSCAQALPIGHPDCAPPKCRCKDGYYRNHLGHCVCWEDCPVCKNPNEIYDPCPAPCPPRTCDVNEALILCLTPPKLGDPNCEPECRCEDGFLRDHTGICIPKNQCPKCTRPNEVFDPCIAPCPPRRCDVDERLIKCAAPPKLGDPLCEAGCRCADGYKANYEGICIPAEECPKCTRPHEVFKSCPVACPPQTCESIGKNYHCPSKHEIKGRIEFTNGVEIIHVCDGQCVCEDGYYRNKIGECISRENCLKCRGPHEFYSCGPACDNVCGLLHVQNQTHCPIVNVDCNRKCYCEPGYARDENNICIPIEDCKVPVPKCGPNERFEVCPPFLCQTMNCTQVGRPIACPVFAGPGCPGKSACICKDGYARDDRGICVPVDQCPRLCPKNEFYSDCVQSNCSPQNCTQLGFPISCPRINPKHCKKGCLCEEGFVRNDRGICIPAEDCPSCGGDPNKVSGCGVFCNQRCSDIGKEPGGCITICYENACDCREGTYLDENTGLCVPSKYCSPQCPINERYSECIQGDCSPQNCDQLGFPVPCPRIDPQNCKKGCLCKEGFVRNDRGICIPAEDCPSCGGDPNKVTGCGVFCNQRCSDVGKEPGACITICYENACDCREGTYLDENTGLCVPSKYCSPQCPINERYSECIQGDCSPQNCDQLGFPVPCPRIDPQNCKKGCLCKEGFVRNDRGICIPAEDCPSCGGDPNKVTGCGVFCNQRCRDVGKEPGACITICYENACDCREDTYLDENTGFCVPAKNCSFQCPANEWYSECVQGNCSPEYCSQLGFPIACPRINPDYCKKGCLCKQGYARDENGICIPTNQCPSCRGDPNAQAGCGGYCNKRCSDIGKEPGACILICEINGCDCKEGYYFDENKRKCVRPEQCTPSPVCLEANNEVYSDCINGGCQAKNCSQYGKPVKCNKIDHRDCIKGCLCKEGYLRASNGKCIPERDCPGACNGPFEEYSECSWNCPPQTCESLDRVYVCPIKDGDNCKPTCRCKPGYYRNKIGQCITEEECRKCTGEHEYYSCGVACDNVCETLDEESQDNCPYVNIKCNEMCYCEKGYARALNNTCIPISRCEEQQCPINEWYAECPAASGKPQYCTQLGFPLTYPALTNDEEYPEEPGCICVDGFVRDNNGKCIPKKECPSCGGDPNALAGCGVNCGKRCSDLGNDDYACIEICYENGCDCKDGFYYDSKQNKCVLPGQCTDICGKNEEFNDCSNPDCTARNCTELGFPLDCESPCKKGCVCKNGYVRDERGRCIPINQCPSCGGDSNAKSGCGVNCGKRCSDIGKGPVACPLICRINSCDCREGFYYDSNTKKCVKSEDCSLICLEQNNEVYSNCINGGCSRKNCSQYGKPVPCIKIDPKYCIKGCLCKEGYLRTADGKCVPEESCPEACNGQNEEYNECSFDCPPQTCESLDRAYACPIIDGTDCKPMCRCKPGFFRNKIGQCITEEQCRKCMGPFEFYSCGGACDNVCETLHERNQTKCPIRNIKCNEMCYCERDYARAKNKTCIPISSCNEPQCPLNERYEQCPAASCEPQYCSQLGYPVPCPLPSPDGRCPGKPGCVCINGYVRDDNGKCIPKKDCPSCGDDVNAQSGCGVNCGKNCRDIGKTDVACIKICYPNACDCKDGYFYDSNQKKCVLPKQCTDIRICGKNEEFEDCSNPTCRVKNCTQLGFPLDCDSECVKGCICKEGFARNAKGKCIPVKQCPSCGGDPNAETGCGVNCLKNCYDLQNPQRPRPCPRICRVNACDCKKGYYLDSTTKKCVLPEKCTPSCGKDEIYSSCINGGCDKKNCSELGKPQLCIDPIKCFGGCTCREGYLRLENGTCVPYDQCPKPKCRKNERFELCPAKICQPQRCWEFGFPLDCPAEDETCPGYPECICNYGYVRNNRGVCRPKEECPSCGGDSNARPGCGINCGKRCPNNNLNPKLCPRICLPNACDCKDGFYYDKNLQSCVKFEDCSPPCNELNNEEYDPCVNGGCGWRNCSEVGGPIFCYDPITCNKGCKCKEGFYRLNDGTCVPEDKCPVSCRKPNEIYDPCPPKCPPQTCESINAKYFCPIQTTDCVGECRCKPNYYRNKVGECISEKNCLKCTGPNEFFSCGPECDNVCSKLDTESQFNCPIKNKKCVSKCYCEYGFARNSKGICIPIDQCPGRIAVTSKPTTKPNTSVDTSVALANFEQGNQNLAAELLYQLYLTRPGENFMVSGFSAAVALAQLVPRAEGTTAEQILRLLNLASKDEVKTVFPILIENYKAQRDVIFKLATKYYGSIKYPFSDGFVQDTEAIFGSEAQNLDFSKNQEAAEIINDWVEDNTNDLIKDLIKADMLSVNTRCVFVNALYFLGNWEKQFNKNLTQPRDFYIDNENSVQVNTMYQEGKFEYGESSELDCKILRLRYKGGNFSYVAFLPNERTGLSSLLENLRKPKKFANSLTLLRKETVEVYLPAMDIDTDISDMKQLLQKVNVTAPFEPSNDLDGILQSGESLFISDAIQKTKIKLDETGTEAAAATAIVVGVTSVLIPPEKFIFNCDRPYAFSLQLDNFPMFTGVYSGSK